MLSVEALVGEAVVHDCVVWVGVAVLQSNVVVSGVTDPDWWDQS